MSSLRRMSGRQVIAVLATFGFDVASQKGSHVKLRRISESGERQTLTIPNHPEIDTGTLHAIIRQASRFIQVELLKSHFYS